MKKLLIGFFTLASLSSFAGTIDVKLNELSNVKIKVDSSIEIKNVDLSLNCHWKPTFFQDLGDEANDIQTERISVEVMNQSSISTNLELTVDEYRISKNKYCLVRFDLDVQSSEYSIYDDSYMTTIRLGTKGDLTKGVINTLKQKTFTPDIFVNARGEKVLNRVLLK